LLLGCAVHERISPNVSYDVRARKRSDPRDKIYGLLAHRGARLGSSTDEDDLVTETMTPVHVDPNKSLGVVYAKVPHGIIFLEKMPVILSYINVNGDELRVKNWQLFAPRCQQQSPRRSRSFRTLRAPELAKLEILDAYTLDARRSLRLQVGDLNISHHGTPCFQTCGVFVDTIARLERDAGMSESAFPKQARDWRYERTFFPTKNGLASFGPFPTRARRLDSRS
jgi:hypothetical protein